MDKIFAALADAGRMRILSVLMGEEKSVTELMTVCGMKQSTLSGNLSILRKAGLVSVAIKDRWRIYSVNQKTVEGFVIEINRFFRISGTNTNFEIIMRKKNVLGQLTMGLD